MIRTAMNIATGTRTNNAVNKERRTAIASRVMAQTMEVTMEHPVVLEEVALQIGGAQTGGPDLTVVAGVDQTRIRGIGIQKE
jgi:NAD-dependent oxidoreductase involved in siderophore biosynthesis